MLFKRNEKEFREIREEVGGLSIKLEALTELLNGQADTLKSISEAQTQEHTKISRNLDKNNMSVEDVLTSVEDMAKVLEEQEDERNQYKEQIRAGRKSEEKLLALIACYQEMFMGIQRYAGEHDKSLEGQLTLMDESIKRLAADCGLVMIKEDNVPVDLIKHEIIDLRETADEALDGVVAEVYSGGYAYKGQTVQKAKVAAYRCGTER